MAVQNINNRVLVFPSRGNLIVSSDLHGNKKDYLQIKKYFSERRKNNEDIYLLFLGDLIHGPKTTDQLIETDFYKDESEFIVDDFTKIQELYQDRVFCLLGNHEHGHIGGPHTAKYCDDEVLALELAIGKIKTKKYLSLFNKLPLLAITSTGVVFSHGAPSPTIKSIDDVISVSYSGHEHKQVSDMFQVPVLDILWRRGSSDENAINFLKLINLNGFKNKIAVYGHDIVREGYCKEGPAHMILSTSFCTKDENKTYLEINLSKKYNSTADVNDCKELKKLWVNYKNNY